MKQVDNVCVEFGLKPNSYSFTTIIISIVKGQTNGNGKPSPVVVVSEPSTPGVKRKRSEPKSATTKRIKEQVRLFAIA